MRQKSDFIRHLAILRKKLVIYLFCFAVVFVLCIAFSSPLFALIAEPLLALLPAQHHLVATQVASPVIVPIKLAFWLSVLSTIPILFWQIWRFALPGLYKNETHLFVLLLVLSLGLFYAGLLFAYFIIIPVLLHFFISVMPEQVFMMADISHYLSFVIRLAIICGLVFEIPVFMLGLLAIESITLTQLRTKRPYVIVGCFVVAMLITPPDAVSQFLLALPMWVLFESGLLLGYLIYKNRKPARE